MPRSLMKIFRQTHRSDQHGASRNRGRSVCGSFRWLSLLPRLGETFSGKTVPGDLRILSRWAQVVVSLRIPHHIPKPWRVAATDKSDGPLRVGKQRLRKSTKNFFAWSFTRPRPRYSARDVALRKQARMRLHVQVRIAAAMPRVVDLLARHQLGGNGLCFCHAGRCGRPGAWAHGCAACEKRDEKRDDQHDEARRADRQAIHLANEWKRRDRLVRCRDSRGERCACQRPDRLSVAMRPTCPPLVDCMFRFAPVACMTRT